MAAFFFPRTIPELCKILYLGQTQALLSSPRVDNKENPLAPKPCWLFTSFPPLSKWDCFYLEITNAQHIHSWVLLIFILALSVRDCCHYTFLSNHLLANEPNRLLSTQSHSSFGSIYWAPMCQALFVGSQHGIKLKSLYLYCRSEINVNSKYLLK